MDSLKELIAAVKEGFAVGVFDVYTEDTVYALEKALAEAESFSETGQSLLNGLQSALDALILKEEEKPDPGVLVVPVNTISAKVGKTQQIKYQWTGKEGALVFWSSNTAVCDVSQTGVLIPLKTGLAVIKITGPNDQFALLTVMVS